MSNLEAGPGSFPVKRAAIPGHPENEQFARTARMIAAAGQQAVTEKEALTTEMLRQIYRLMLQDNNLMRAYGKLIEIDKAQDEPGSPLPRRGKVPRCHNSRMSRRRSKSRRRVAIGSSSNLWPVIHPMKPEHVLSG